jgi:uncharacterized damage-inducible protein DinB
MLAIAELLLLELDREAVGTRRTLQRVPESREEWRPHPKSMRLGDLAGLVATLPSWVAAIIERNELDLEDPGRYGSRTIATNRELLAVFDRSLAEARTALAGTDDEHLMTSWRLRMGDTTLLEQPRHIAVRDGVFNHLVHHRGQLTVYLRLNERPVPALYGPSADEGGM